MYVSNETHILLVQDGDTSPRVILEPRGSVVALAVDEARGLLFWANNDGRYRGVYSANTDGSEVTRIVQKGKRFM